MAKKRTALAYQKSKVNSQNQQGHRESRRITRELKIGIAEAVRRSLRATE